MRHNFIGFLVLQYVFYSGKNACSFSHTLIPNIVYEIVSQQYELCIFRVCQFILMHLFYLQKFVEVKGKLPEANKDLCNSFDRTCGIHTKARANLSPNILSKCEKPCTLSLNTLTVQGAFYLSHKIGSCKCFI